MSTAVNAVSDRKTARCVDPMRMRARVMNRPTLIIRMVAISSMVLSTTTEASDCCLGTGAIIKARMASPPSFADGVKCPTACPAISAQNSVAKEARPLPQQRRTMRQQRVRMTQNRTRRKMSSRMPSRERWPSRRSSSFGLARTMK